MTSKKSENKNTVTRPKKWGKTAFVVSVMLAITIASVLLTVTMVNNKTGPSSPRDSALAMVANPNYAFSQAEIECLNKVKRTFRYPNALFVDDRSTQDLGGGEYRVFIKVDPAIGMGIESFIVCQAEIIDGYIKVTKAREIRAGKQENKGMKLLLDALKIED